MPRARSERSTRKTAPLQVDSTRVVSSTADSELPEAEVRQRAYEIHLARNGRPGDPLGDWIQAEHELRGRRTLLFSCANSP